MTDSSKYEAIEHALKRERLARKSAEIIIEEKSKEIFLINKELQLLNKDLEQRIEERTEDLEKAKKIAEEATKAKSSFLSNMSHEIRTPLNGIISISQLLLDEDLTDKSRGMLESVKYSADNLLKIINEILDFSKIEAGKTTFEKVNFNLKRLLNEVHKGMGFTANLKGLDLIADFDPDLPEFIIGDSVKLNQVLNNLIGNAIKFTAEGYIKISIKIHSAILDNGSSAIHVVIKDTGMGIPEDKISKLFESFSQTDNSISRKYGGTGLGLNISKNLVELQGGHLYVTSKVNQGSEFIFTYPFTPVKDQTSQVTPAEKHIFERLSIKTLLVEDNKINQFIASQFLQKWGVEFDIANNGKEALYLLTKNSYDIVLMDILMPELDGLSTTRIIRDKESTVLQHDIPIIALTANAFEQAKKEIFESGMNAFVSKPLVPELLHEKLKSLTQDKN